MNLIDIDDGIAFFGHALHYRLDAFLEVASVGCASHHRAHIHLIYARAFQSIRHIARFYPCGKSIDECSLAHTRFAHVQRVVLLASAQYLYGAVEFLLTPDERIVVFEHVIDTCHELAPVLFLLDLLISIVHIVHIVIEVYIRVIQVRVVYIYNGTQQFGLV